MSRWLIIAKICLSMRFSLIAPFLINAIATASAQTPFPQFEIATVKPPGPQDRRIARYNYPGGRVILSQYTAAQLLHEALGVQRFQLVGAPAWISDVLLRAAWGRRRNGIGWQRNDGVHCLAVQQVHGRSGPGSNGTNRPLRFHAERSLRSGRARRMVRACSRRTLAMCFARPLF
jgi:hypothetical protein